MRQLESDGLNRAAAGNASVRTPAGLLITPTGVVPARLAPYRMVAMTLAGEVLAGEHQPSSEWRFHRDIYRARPAVMAIVHVHSPYATALACTRSEIPAFHYMVAVGGGDNIRCAPYATFGTQALSDYALAALSERHACLLANHGLIALGADLDGARRLTLEIEELARQYLLALQTGRLVLLSPAEMTAALEAFKTYGQPKE
ncbi:MAG: class II aldolase [Gammaproteobacteria bacterium]|nr:class II aldolase [Gammaproteobacteria bacterium]